MKATINYHGDLKVTAENDIESYALMKWSQDYFINKEERQSTLSTDFPAFDGVTKTQEVKK